MVRRNPRASATSYQRDDEYRDATRYRHDDPKHQYLHNFNATGTTEPGIVGWLYDSSERDENNQFADKDVGSGDRGERRGND